MISLFIRICRLVLPLFFFQIGLSAILAYAGAPKIEAGVEHSLLLQSDGTLWSWGTNTRGGDNTELFGQLGDGVTDFFKTTPVMVSGFSDVISISAGHGHTIALKADGTVWAIGNNTYGQLGNGTYTSTSTPVEVVGLDNIVAVAAGGLHSMALKSDGSVWTWGWNIFNQLGRPSEDCVVNGWKYSCGPTPGRINGFSNIIKLSGGYGHSVALKSDGSVWTWGWNEFGQLGDGTTVSKSVPVQVAGISNTSALSSGYGHTSVLTSDGTVWSWGRNDFSQLGRSTTDQCQTYNYSLTKYVTIACSASPGHIPGLNNIIDLKAGDHHTVALKSDNTVWAWGNNESGQLGDGTTTQSLIPLQLPNAHAVAIASRGGHILLLKADGSLWSIGNNTSGQLGDNSRTNSVVLVRVQGQFGQGYLNAWTRDRKAWQRTIAGGKDFAISRKTDGTVWFWGAGSNSAPSPLSGVSDITLVAASDSHAVLLKADRTVWEGVPGSGRPFSKVDSLGSVIDVAAGIGYTLALKSDHTLWAWMTTNDSGQTANSNVSNSSSPVKIPFSSAVIDFAAGNNHAVVVTIEGTVWAWGDNTLGQLGTGNNISSNIPVSVSNLNGVIAVSAGDRYSMALKDDGTVLEWGVDDSPKAGDWIPNYSNIPVVVAGLDNVIDIAAGGRHSLALKNDHSVWAWRGNDRGQLGDDTTTDNYTPVAVVGLSEVAAIATGSKHSLALKKDGSIWSWGDNLSGQLGDASLTASYASTQVQVKISSADFWVKSVSPDSGIYKTGQQITLRCWDSSNACTAIYYTIDGSFPTTASNQYSTPININSDSLVKYLSVDNNGMESPVGVARYTIDTVMPTVQISQPADGSMMGTVYNITGSVTDNKTGLSSVSLQVTDGNYYLNSNQGFSLDPTWINILPTAAAETDYGGSFTFDTSQTNWSEGVTYTITVKGVDVAGNSAKATTSFTYFSGEQAYTTLSLELASQSILQNETLDVSGKLSRLPDTDVDIREMPVVIEVIAPDSSSYSKSVTTYDKYGHFIIHGLDGFTQKGSYTIKVSFAETLMYAASSASDNVLVGDSPGYAIIIEGKIDNNEGLESHKKTANRIYQHFIDRGFRTEDILYLNYDITQTGVTSIPSKNAVQNAIETWAANKLTDIAAPLYLVMVDHGNINTFYIGGNTAETTITPKEMASWLDNLDQKLADTPAKDEKKIIVIGSCYSGSFISSLSKTGRVIVTSAAADEVSYKGPLEPDNIRVGEFFLEELFLKLGKGDSLYHAFVGATKNTELFTRSGAELTNSSYPYFDTAQQHPLLDDNGDGRGSNILAINTEEGKSALEIYLGVGLTNAAANVAAFYEVTGTKVLNADQNTTILWGKNQDPTNVNTVSSAWLEIRKPSMVLSSQTSTGQIEINLDKQLMTYDDQLLNAWLYSFDGIDEAGKYEVFYFTRNKDTGEISPMNRSLIYKKKEGNKAPTTFSLVSPLNTSKHTTVLTFDWQDSTDPEGNPLTYTLIIGTGLSTSGQVEDVVYRKEELRSSAGFVDMSAGLADLTTYYWQVIAIDTYGEISRSDAWSFDTDNTNGIPGIIRGMVYSNKDMILLSNALVTINTGETIRTELDGSFYLLTNSGSITLSCSVEGQETALAENIIAKSGEVTDVRLALGTKILPGDINGDNAVNLADALLVSKILIGQKPLGQIKSNSDINNDYHIDAAELIYILRRVSGVQ